MLVIRRRPGESLLIGADVEIEVLEAGSSNVKLGIRAPKNVNVWRKEVYLTLQQNKVASRGVSPEALTRLLNKLR
jgi:carbon storage regulator